MSNSSGALLNLVPTQDYAELEKDPDYMQGLLKHAVSLAMKGFTLDQIKSQTNYSGSTDQLLELINDALENNLRLYKTIYKTRQILSLGNDLQKLDETIDSCNRPQLLPALLSTKLKISQEQTRLLDEVSGNRKPGLQITYSIEGVDLSAI